MRSQYIKIRNLDPFVVKTAYTIRVKPWWLLWVIFFSGVVLVTFRSYTAGIALPLLILTLFCLFVMPDRILVQFTPDYMIMYNRQDKNEATLIYYDEIVQWQYEYHRSSDTFVVTLKDGSSQSVDMFAKYAISRPMKMFSPFKENKYASRKSL